MLSSTSEYALRATLYVAMHQYDGPVKRERISEALEIPANYLSKTLHQLARAGILTSGRGPHGGFVLARPADSLTLADVVATFDPLRFARRCLLGEGECSDLAPCAVHHRWKPVADPMRAFFSRTTIGELIRDQSRRSS